jgi:hypothetical protein
MKNKDTPPIEKVEVLDREIPKKIFKRKKKVPKVRETGIIPAHRLIFKNYQEQGYRHMGKAIRRTDVYSENVAIRTDKITTTKSWKMLMDEAMPEDMVARVHSGLLNKREFRKVKNVDGSETEIDNGPDTAASSKALDMVYKLRGAYKEDKGPKKQDVTYNLFYKPEIREQMKSFEAGLKQSIFNDMARKNHIKDEEEDEGEDDSAIGGGVDEEEGGAE